jgi:DNA polymerase delta subunit 1
MPEAIMPQKRVLGDTTNNARNAFASPNAMKKRKLDNETGAQLRPPTQNVQRKGFGSSQPQKSTFEEEVLEKMTQDISELKERNAEKDQQWERPALGPFDPAADNICFQQIDAEEGRMAGDKMAVRLFGVTEVMSSLC